MKSPRPKISPTIAMTTMTSTKVKPPLSFARRIRVPLLSAMGIQVLGNLIDGRDDRDGDKANHEAHDKHEDRLDGTAKSLGHLVNVVLIELGEVLERAH